MICQKIMNRLVGSVFIGAMLVLLLMSSVASIPGGESEQTDARVAKFTAADDDSSQPVHHGYLPPLAQVDWIPFSFRIPSVLGTVLSGACLLLPFGLSTVGTLRKRP
jgi:hypothetical protein